MYSTLCSSLGRIRSLFSFPPIPGPVIFHRNRVAAPKSINSHRNLTTVSERRTCATNFAINYVSVCVRMYACVCVCELRVHECTFFFLSSHRSSIRRERNMQAIADAATTTVSLLSGNCNGVQQPARHTIHSTLEPADCSINEWSRCRSLCWPTPITRRSLLALHDERKPVALRCCGCSCVAVVATSADAAAAAGNCSAPNAKRTRAHNV